MTFHSSSNYLTSLFGLEGKTALITGGTRGIGRGLATALASAGANLVFLCRNANDPTVTSTCEAVGALGRDWRCFQCDLSNRADVQRIVHEVCVTNLLEIDIFVHCGGIQHRTPAEDFPDSAWDDIISVNLTAGFVLTRELAKHWLSTTLTPADGRSLPNRKKVIFIASVLCFTGSVEVPAYVSSKGALMALTKALSNEWMGRGINVNAIAPGYFATNLTTAIRENEEKERHILERVPAGRWGDADRDLSGAVIHLASRASDFVGGTVFVVDGGFCAR